MLSANQKWFYCHYLKNIKTVRPAELVTFYLFLKMGGGVGWIFLGHGGWVCGSLESMLDVVKKSEVVLLSLSQKYKDSPACRTGNFLCFYVFLCLPISQVAGVSFYMNEFLLP